MKKISKKDNYKDYFLGKCFWALFICFFVFSVGIDLLVAQRWIGDDSLLLANKVLDDLFLLLLASLLLTVFLFFVLKDCMSLSCFSAMMKKDKQLDDNFKKMKAEMEKRKKFFEAQSEYVAIMSHKLRTPVNGVRWNLEMLINEEFGALDPKHREIINDAFHANDRSIVLIEELLKVSKVEFNKLALKPVEFDINESIEKAIGSLLFKIKARNIEITKSFEKESFNLTADKKQVEEVVTNLLDNAIKYSGVNGRQGKINIGYELKGKKLVFFVKDNGVGIPKKEQKKMFKKFSRASNVLGLDTDGTGLGLFICHEIARLLKGKIWFDSVEDKGTQFYFEIPQK